MTEKVRNNAHNEREWWSLAAPYPAEKQRMMVARRPTNADAAGAAAGAAAHLGVPVMGPPDFDLAAVQTDGTLLSYQDMHPADEQDPPRCLRRVKVRQLDLDGGILAVRPFDDGDPSLPYFVTARSGGVVARGYNGRKLWEGGESITDAAIDSAGCVVTGAGKWIRKYSTAGVIQWSTDLEIEDVRDPPLSPECTAVRCMGTTIYVTAKDASWHHGSITKINSSGVIQQTVYPDRNGDQDEHEYLNLEPAWDAEQAIYVGLYDWDNLLFAVENRSSGDLSRNYITTSIAGVRQISIGNVRFFTLGWDTECGDSIGVVGQTYRSDGSSASDSGVGGVTALAAAREGSFEHPSEEGETCERIYIARDSYRPYLWAAADSEGNGFTYQPQEIVRYACFGLYRCYREHTTDPVAGTPLPSDDYYWKPYTQPSLNTPAKWVGGVSYDDDFNDPVGSLVRDLGERYRCYSSHVSSEENRPPGLPWVAEPYQPAINVSKCLIGYDPGGTPSKEAHSILETYWTKRTRGAVGRLWAD